MPAVPVNSGAPNAKKATKLGQRTPGYVGVDPQAYASFRSDALDKLTANGRTSYSAPSPTLRKNEVRDTKAKDAITQALLRAKSKYRYTSGNLRKLLGSPGGVNKMIES
jgi:hypothetical protein